MGTLNTISPDRPLRIGTRASPLAMAQAHMTAAALKSAHGWGDDHIELVPMVASGDKILDRALAEVGGKALWTKELDRALGLHEIDCAVHSMKDVETIRPVQFCLAAMLPRADGHDRLIGAESLAALPEGATVGTASPRRTAQVLRIRPDLKIALIRGNVATRLARVEAGEFAATLLAAAGLNRLGQADVGVDMDFDQMLPAPSQGAVGIECRADDDATRALMSAIDHAPTTAAVLVERAFLYGLGADCQSPVAARAEIAGDQYTLTARIYSSDGAAMEEGMVSAPVGDLITPGELAEAMLARAPESIRRLFPK